MHCNAQLFVDAMATRRHILRHFGTAPVTSMELFEKLAVTDHDINRSLLIGATGNVRERIIFVDGSSAACDENVWTVKQQAIKTGEEHRDSSYSNSQS